MCPKTTYIRISIMANKFVLKVIIEELLEVSRNRIDVDSIIISDWVFVVERI